ncbi:DUF1439 domain-containing protein [Shewanella waksmanii]|uniref:DUF1439 domain-containing protein n=1 Tax=Shewanella waksmanii TaxID=213783 RepID=UPI0004B5DA5B|nr:DUF1439 domain-containing protein [Shewanella waksmanii]
MISLKSAPLILATLLLTGCVSQYSISERELEGYLSDEIHFEVKQGNQFFGIELTIAEIDVNLGDKPEIMAVTAHSLVKVRNPIMPFKAEVTTTFEAKPWYDPDKHAVYLKDLSLTKVESTPDDIEKAINPVAPQMMGFVRHFLETQPVYVLDTQDGNQALLAEMTKRIEVVPGKLKLIFDE